MSERSGHFERIAETYDRARPAYPAEVYDALDLVPGTRVLELGAGSGLATAELVRRGARVTAVEPGRDLAAILAARLPEVALVVATAEEAAYPDEVDLVVSATAWHWLDHAVVLPRLHAAARPGARLAVWSTVYGDPDVATPFRERVDRIAADAGLGDPVGAAALRLGERRAALEAGGWWETEEPVVVRWTTTLTTSQVRDLFTTFPTWTPDLVEQVAAAADACGGEVEEHYVTVLHLARRVEVTPGSST